MDPPSCQGAFRVFVGLDIGWTSYAADCGNFVVVVEESSGG